MKRSPILDAVRLLRFLARIKVGTAPPKLDISEAEVASAPLERDSLNPGESLSPSDIALLSPIPLSPIPLSSIPLSPSLFSNESYNSSDNEPFNSNDNELFNPSGDVSNPLSGGTDRHHNWRRSATLPIYIGTVPVTAIPDTGSDENAISSTFAKGIGLYIETSASSPVSFQLANGRSIKSSGIALATCSFGKDLNKESETSILFNVFSKLAVPVVIGRAFLQATETLTKHSDRLDISIHRSPLVLPRILHLNRPQQRLRCYLNVNLAYANADTGAEMNLVSPGFAAQRGFQIEEPDAEHQEVVLADGSRAPISGQFRARFDTFDRPSREVLRPRAHEKYFYILDGLTTDVLLCEDLLFEISAFSDQQNSFVDLDCLGIFSDLNLVTWLSRREKRLLRIPGSQSSASTALAGVTSGLAPGDPSAALEVAFQLELDDDDAHEQYVRQSADREIAHLSEPDKLRRRAAEDNRRQSYDENRARRVQEHNIRMAAMSQQNRAASNASGRTH